MERSHSAATTASHALEAEGLRHHLHRVWGSVLDAGFPTSNHLVYTLLFSASVALVALGLSKALKRAPGFLRKQPERASRAQVSPLLVFPPSTADRLGLRKDLAGWDEEARSRQLQAHQAPSGLAFDRYPTDARTPTDMTVEEIRSLGDFPDYAKLTGVPHPRPDPSFVYERSIARPYRPLRWKWVQNMSLMKLETDRWLELTSDYRSMLQRRQDLLRKHGKPILDCRPEAELAAKEIMEMALQFYCKRYPSYFQLEERNDAGWVFVNKILGNETVIRDSHPLQVLFDNIPEEFLLTVRNKEDGLYYLRGGICCSAVGWTMAQKMDKPLQSIHGPVPNYKNMAFSMDRFFSKMPCDRPIQRGSFEIKTGRPLFAPPEEIDQLNKTYQDPSLNVDDISFRVDWQTLRRLPLSGAIVFNFKCLFFPMTELRDEKHLPSLLHKILTEGEDEMLKYKHSWPLEHVLLPSLKAWEEEQERSGMVERGWEPHTLDNSPFFDGWKEKWESKMKANEVW